MRKHISKPIRGINSAEYLNEDGWSEWYYPYSGSDESYMYFYQKGDEVGRIRFNENDGAPSYNLYEVDGKHKYFIGDYKSLSSAKEAWMKYFNDESEVIESATNYADDAKPGDIAWYVSFGWDAGGPEDGPRIRGDYDIIYAPTKEEAEAFVDENYGTQFSQYEGCVAHKATEAELRKYEEDMREADEMYKWMEDNTEYSLYGSVGRNKLNIEAANRILYPSRYIGEFADGYSCEIGGDDIGDCLYRLTKLEDRHGELVWYGGVNDDDYVDGELRYSDSVTSGTNIDTGWGSEIGTGMGEVFQDYYKNGKKFGFVEYDPENGVYDVFVYVYRSRDSFRGTNPLSYSEAGTFLDKKSAMRCLESLSASDTTSRNKKAVLSSVSSKRLMKIYESAYGEDAVKLALDCCSDKLEGYEFDGSGFDVSYVGTTSELVSEVANILKQAGLEVTKARNGRIEYNNDGSDVSIKIYPSEEASTYSENSTGYFIDVENVY